MKRDQAHVSDEDLLRAADGEASESDLARIDAHLSACWTCRARRSEIDQAIGDFVSAYHRHPEVNLPAIDGPRALLRARIREMESVNPQTRWERFREFTVRMQRPLYGGLCAAAILLGALVYSGVPTVRASSVPDSTLTPGATRTTEKEDVCSSRPLKGFYPIPATLAYRVFEKYRIRNPGAGTYEVDYLITPALGGADDIKNLWPQPYDAGEWNAHAKDALEQYLHQLVCAGQLDLATAQRDISANWIAAYRKYFRTDQPLVTHARFSIDSPWED